MKCKGFTLVELITIIIILGILAAYAAPRFFSVGDTDVIAAEVSLASMLRAQQQRAMQDTANAGYGVNIESQNGNTMIRAVNQNTPAESDSRQVLHIDASIAVLSPTHQLRFNASGCINTCGEQDLTITLVGQTTRSVCVNRQGFITHGPCQTS